MSFFGLQETDLEEEKRRFLQGGSREDEDIAVYNWGQDDFNSLGNALQEGGDELNDETFGGSEPVGKDFDFAAQTLPDLDKSHKPTAQAERAREVQRLVTPVKSVEAPRQPLDSRESIWDDKSPFSVLPRSSASSIGRRAGTAHQSNLSGHTPVSVRFSSRDSPQPQHPPHPPVVQHGSAPLNYASTGIRTAEEVEAEMRSQLLAQRTRAAQQQLQQQHSQLQLQPQKPPRMRSQSPSAYTIQQAHYQRREQSPSLMLQHQQQLEHARMEEKERQLREQSLASRIQEQRVQEVREAQAFQRAQAIQLEQQMLLQMSPNQIRSGGEHRRQASGATLAELQIIQQQLQAQALSGTIDTQLLRYFNQQIQLLQREQLRVQSPQTHYGLHTPTQTLSHAQAQAQSQALMQNLQNVQNVQNVQLQQRLLAQLAQAEFSQSFSGPAGGTNGSGLSQSAHVRAQEALRVEAMRKITEAERLEGKRRRKAAKIAHMSHFNDLMTQSDKDFITRIQVSQLVTSDPYTEDFYAQVFTSRVRSRMGLNSEERVLKFGSGEGVGLGVGQRGGGRRPNAMQRMEAQVERIVNNARLREKEKGLHAIHSLQGALGKTAGRSYKAAPRQLLQVDLNGQQDDTPGSISNEEAKENTAGAAKEAAKRGREALRAHASEQQTGEERRDALTRRETLSILEDLYDMLLKIEQLDRIQPSPEEGEDRAIEQKEKINELVFKIHDGLQVKVHLHTCEPHPFVSLLMPTKGKKLIHRVARFFDSRQLMTLLTLLVACFRELDVVRDAPLLDSGVDSVQRREVEQQTKIFIDSVLLHILPVVAKMGLRVIGWLIGLLTEGSETHVVVRSRPGLLLLSTFLGRVAVIKAEFAAGTVDGYEAPTEDDLLLWQNIHSHLFNLLAPYILDLFPSPAAMVLSLSSQDQSPDILEEPVWQFLAMLSLEATNEQQQLLVTTLREKILDNVMSVSKGMVADEAVQQIKISNVNIFLHALGLDSSQISM